jgi:hypothetical protein
MMRNVLIIAAIFGFIYFKMFWGVINKDELAYKVAYLEITIFIDSLYIK